MATNNSYRGGRPGGRFNSNRGGRGSGGRGYHGKRRTQHTPVDFKFHTLGTGAGHNHGSCLFNAIHSYIVEKVQIKYGHDMSETIRRLEGRMNIEAERPTLQSVPVVWGGNFIERNLANEAFKLQYTIQIDHFTKRLEKYNNNWFQV